MRGSDHSSHSSKRSHSYVVWNLQRDFANLSALTEAAVLEVCVRRLAPDCPLGFDCLFLHHGSIGFTAAMPTKESPSFGAKTCVLNLMLLFTRTYTGTPPHLPQVTAAVPSRR